DVDRPPVLLVSLTRAGPPTSTPFPYTTLFRSGRIWATPDDDHPFPVKETYLDFAPEDRRKIYPGPTLWLRSVGDAARAARVTGSDRKSTRLNSSHVKISYAVFCLKKKKNNKSR